MAAPMHAPAHRAWAELGTALLAEARDDALVAERRVQFRVALEEDVPFSIVAANAWLDADEAEVLAVLCAAEMEPGRNRLTLGDLARIEGDKRSPVLAVSPQSRLTAAALVEVGTQGRWAARSVSVAPSVCWALIGDPSQDPDLDPDVRLLPAPADEVAQGRRLLVVGADRQRRRQLALASAAGLRFLVGPPPADEGGWSAMVREATLRGAGVVLELSEAPDRLARRWLQTAGHLTWVLSSATELPLETVPEDVWRELVAPDTPTTPAEWEQAIGDPHPSAHGLTGDQLQLVARPCHGRRRHRRRRASTGERGDRSAGAAHPAQALVGGPGGAAATAGAAWRHRAALPGTGTGHRPLGAPRAQRPGGGGAVPRALGYR
ncbi:MAG: hypothetical protein R2749_15245 [Acidimicrobiales bacterium]